MIKKIAYISEINFPSSSAQSIHVAKMCDAFASIGLSVSLYTLNLQCTEYIFKKIYNNNNYIQINSIFKNKKKISFFNRFIFAIKILSLLKKEDNYIISRSIISSIILAFLNIKSSLEIHHEISGVSKFLFQTLNVTELIKNIKLILVHKNLISKFRDIKCDYIVLDDAVDLNNFSNKYKNHKKIKKTCVYIGSFHKGKGVELIRRIAEKTKDIQFHLYGDIFYIGDKKFSENVKIFDHINYSQIPNILSRYEVALMPYSNKISARSKKLNISNYISPLKMFEYLAAKKIIVASRLPVYEHILRNNFNSILIDNKKILLWSYYLKLIFRDLNAYKYLKKNALTTARKYTWKNRAIKIYRYMKTY